MADLHVGDIVWTEEDLEEGVRGTIVKKNRKTVVCDYSGDEYNVYADAVAGRECSHSAQSTPKPKPSTPKPKRLTLQGKPSEVTITTDLYNGKYLVVAAGTYTVDELHPLWPQSDAISLHGVIGWFSLETLTANNAVIAYSQQAAKKYDNLLDQPGVIKMIGTVGIPHADIQATHGLPANRLWVISDIDHTTDRLTIVPVNDDDPARLAKCEPHEFTTVKVATTIPKEALG